MQPEQTNQLGNQTIREQSLSMVGRCSHCCNLMNNRVDVSDLEVGARIRVGDNDLATIKYIGEVSIINCDSITLICILFLYLKFYCLALELMLTIEQ